MDATAKHYNKLDQVADDDFQNPISRRVNIAYTGLGYVRAISL